MTNGICVLRRRKNSVGKTVKSCSDVNSTLIDQSFFSSTIPLFLLVFLEIFIRSLFFFISASLIWKNTLQPHHSLPTMILCRLQAFSFTKKISSGFCLYSFFCSFNNCTLSLFSLGEMIFSFFFLFLVIRLSIFQLWCFPSKLFLKFSPTLFIQFQSLFFLFIKRLGILHVLSHFLSSLS